MDLFLFQNLVPLGELPDDGPQNSQRVLVNTASLWLNGPHEDFVPCAFNEYLAVRGWNKEKLLQGQWRTAHPLNGGRNDEDCLFAALGVLQSWLTYGFFDALFQERVPVERYLKDLDEETLRRIIPMTAIPWDILERRGFARIFHTKHFVSNLVALGFRLRVPQLFGINADVHMQRAREAYVGLIQALSALNSLEKYDPETDTTSHPIDVQADEGILLFLMLPLPTLIACAVRLHLNMPDANVDMPYRIGEHQKQELVTLGWCPYTLNKLETTTGYSVFYWLWASGFPGLSTKSHLSCSEDACRAYKSDPSSSYKVAHSEACTGDCGLYQPHIDQIKTILEADRIPIITYTRGDQTRAIGIDTLHVQEHHPQLSPLPYSAFSHVWADGLGSTTEEGLPICRVKLLGEFCFSISEASTKSVSFWIDSLCVPEASGLRNKAIQLMSETYRSANSVIVIDSTLGKCTVKTSPEELLLRIYTSPWMDRVWTFQEGVLAKRLYFRFSDAFCLLDFPVDPSSEAVGPLHITAPRHTMHNIYMHLRSQVQNLNSAVTPINIGHVALELRWRNTTHRNPFGRNDELIVTGILLGLDMAKLLEVEGEERMKALLLMIKKLPSNLVFSQVRRLQIPGFRWAPTTFLSEDGRRPATNLEVHGALCTSAGLIGNYMTFTSSESSPVQVAPNMRCTIVDSTADGVRWFDVTNLEHSFIFNHIIIYPQEVPKSIRGEIFIAAAVTNEFLPHGEMTGVDRDIICQFEAVTHIKIICKFEAVVHASCLREFSDPPGPRMRDVEPRIVMGHFKSQRLLLR